MKPRNIAVAVLFLIALVTAAYVLRQGAHAKPLPGVPLRTLGAQRGIDVGTAVRGDVLQHNRAYRELVAAQFSTVTPENERKWDAVEPERGDFHFGAADEIVSRAREAGQKVRGHTLVWHAQIPDWVRHLDAADLRDAMHEHIDRVMGHFGSAADTWDVVNEPITDGGRLRESVFERRLGPGYFADALRTARAADPGAKLYINEIGAEGINPKSDRLYEVVRDLKQQGVPIDGVSFQTHANLNGLPSDMVDNMRRFKALGLDVAITEADVALKLPASEADLQEQARIYTQIIDNCRAADCRSLTFWGFTDGRSWISETQAGMGAATLLDEQLRPKPAFYAVQRALGG